MGVDARLAETARRSANFGYLLDHEPLLVLHGAAAEAYVFTDPNTSMLKSRQFGEALTHALFVRFGLPNMPSTQAQRLKMLADQGVITQRVRSWFDDVRKKGNRANHEHYESQRDALLLVRACYELGAWFFRTVAEHGAPPPFVPPQPPAGQPEPANQADARALQELRDQLAFYRAELVEMRLSLDQQTSMAQAQVEARRQAEREILDAVRAQGELRDLVHQLSAKVTELQRQLSERATHAEAIAPAERDRLVWRSQLASHPPLNEAQVRERIDEMLTRAGWVVQDLNAMNLHAAQGVAVREVPTAAGRADYLLYVDRKLVGVVEAKREGASLTSAEQQSQRYAAGLTAAQRLAAWRTPLPFRYESTAVETRFTNGLDPAPRPRRVFSFHQPGTLARWMRDAEASPEAPTLRARLRQLPPLAETGLRPAQIEAITCLERSLADDRPRALIQMATGAGKTFTMVTEAYRLLRHGGARRVLFLVDRNNLGRQAETAFRNYVTPEGDRFAELYRVQRLAGGVVLDSASVVISTVQRMYSMLTGQELPDDETEAEETPDAYAREEAVQVSYNPAVPPETFDLVIVDECHRSIYGVWRQVLEYFDAYLVGLTATPVAQTFGFFEENLVSQYTYQQAVADGVNVDYEIMRIRTEVTERGGTIPADTPVRIVDRRTRRERYETLDTALDYTGDQIGRSVMNPSQIRTAIRAFRDHWREYFPHREYVPKTLIFAKTDQHADEIVKIVREEFGRGGEFCVKITYRSDDPEGLLKRFRNDAAIRIAVTVDMIATGTDVKPLECVFFLRGVSSRTYFEQMKGRGARTTDPDEFQTVTPDARNKTKFLLVDAVGVTESPLVDARPLQPPAKRSESLERLLAKAAAHSLSAEEAETLASRLGALQQQITEEERRELAEVGRGHTLTGIARGLQQATDVDVVDGLDERERRELLLKAVEPLAANPELRERILSLRRKYDLPYDEYTRDRLIAVEARRLDRDRSQETVEDWRRYLEEHRDEVTALRLAFEDPRRDPRQVYAQLRDLARRIERPPYRWTPEKLWAAYEALGVARDGGGRTKGVPELIGILRYELGLDPELRSYRSRVEENLRRWLAQQEQAGARFTPDQRWWIERIAHAVANRLCVTEQELETTPFTERGGVDGYLRAFGEDRAVDLLDELNKELPA